MAAPYRGFIVYPLPVDEYIPGPPSAPLLSESLVFYRV